MSLWRHLTLGFRGLFRREAAERDVADEVEHYLDETARSHEARGVPPDEARRLARLEAGHPTAIRDVARSVGWEQAPGALLSDLRHGARRLARNPGFTAVSVLTLALGIGAGTAIFSAVNPILFRPLPYPHPGQILSVWDNGGGGVRTDVTFGTFRELAERARSFETAAALKPWQPVLTGLAEPERLEGQRVSAGYFPVLGIRPALGHDFAALDDRVNGPNVVMLSDGLWRRRFGGDPAILDRQITLNGNPYTVIGVLPAGFENVLAPGTEVWALLQYDASLPPEGREWGHHLHMIARLRPGTRVEDAARELDLIAKNPTREFARQPWASLATGLIVNPLHDDVTRAVRPALLAIIGAVLLLLAIACVNVTSMLLARGARRQSEFAMRAALGAPRGRLARLVLVESLLLAGLGGLLGLLVAEAGLRALVALSPQGLPRIGALRVDGSAFLFALVVVTLAGIAAGLIPALAAGRGDPRTALGQGARTMTAGHHALRRALVVSEVALALVLLVGAGLLLRSLGHLFAVSPGFSPERLLTMQVYAAGHRYDDQATTNRFFEQALDAVRRVPGVEAAAFTSQLPLSGDFEKYGAVFESAPEESAGQDGSVFRYGVSAGYIEAMGIPLRQGRLLDARDDQGLVSVLISESFARRRFPGLNPIGQRLHLGATDQPWYTIVGVVADVSQASLAVTPGDAVYLPASQWYGGDRVLSIVVRSRGDAASLAPAVKDAIWSVDKDQPVARVATMDGLLAASAATRRFALVLFEAFALAALVLAAIGLYGVQAGSVAERVREIGVRSALGATRESILVLVIRQGMSLTALGVLIGLAGAFAASRIILTLLFGVSRLDPVTYAGVVILLVLVSIAACWLPAWRASRVDPAVTLRME